MKSDRFWGGVAFGLELLSYALLSGIALCIIILVSERFW